MGKLRAAACLLASVGIAPAQTTHVVGSGGFAQVQDALAVAAPGDVVHVLPGSYAAFTVTDEVTVRAAVPGTVVIGALISLAITTVDLPAHGFAELVDLELFALHVTGGTVALDGCRIRSMAFSAGNALIVQNANVVLQACELSGGHGFGSGPGHQAALRAEQALISAVDCSLHGSDVGSISDGPPPGVAIELVDSTLHASSISATGGSGVGTGVNAPLPAVRATASTVWISDSTLTGGARVQGTGPPACPLEVSAGALDRCVLAPVCAAGVPTDGPLLGLHRIASMTSPGALPLQWNTDVHGLVGVFLADDVQASLLQGLFEQPVWLDGATLRPLALVVADAQGVANYTCTIPAGLTHRTFWFQGVAATDPLQLSPAVGGVVR